MARSCRGASPSRIDQLNAELRQWCVEEAGQRIHGTIRKKPLEVFEEQERQALQPLPTAPFDLPTWKDVKLHRDCHVQFEKAWYSAPFRYVGETVRVRGGLSDVRIYDRQTHELIAVHEPAKEPGVRRTIVDHLPDTKRAGLELTRANCRCRAEAIGPFTTAVVNAMLDHRPEDRLRMAGRLLELGEHLHGSLVWSARVPGRWPSRSRSTARSSASCSAGWTNRIGRAHRTPRRRARRCASPARLPTSP